MISDMEHDCREYERSDTVDAFTRISTNLSVTENGDKVYRTALIIEEGNASGSVDLIDADGKFLARINIFHADNWLGVDVIDVEDKWSKRRVLSFVDGVRQSLDCTKVAAVDFRDD